LAKETRKIIHEQSRISVNEQSIGDYFVFVRFANAISNEDVGADLKKGGPAMTAHGSRDPINKKS
jgi:hypothetical protein